MSQRIKKNKDNPVPSLTKKEIEYIKENLSNAYFFGNRLYNSIINKLNGVETYKEEPELTVSGKKKCMIG